jgi:uncharacterized protein
MKKHWAFFLAFALVVSLSGCRSPWATSNSVPNQASPVPKEPAFDPLGKLEKSLIYFPARYPAGNWQPPGLVFEDAWFTADDGTRLHGWYIPHEHPRAFVLYCHGNAGNLTDWADVMHILHDRLGAAVLIFDYRGYGRSEGKPSEAGVLADARAARAWLAARGGIAEDQIVLMGRSLGGAVAVDLAADGARGLVLESTFTSLPDVGKSAYPWLPLGSIARSQFNSLAKIPQYRGPLLQSHGTSDRLIPYAMGCQLFDAAGEPKRFVPIPGGDHNDPQTEEYYRALAAFLDGLK